MAVRKSKASSLLVQDHLVSPEQLEQATQEQKRTGKSLQATLIDLGHVNGEEVAKLYSKKYSVPYLNIDEFDIDQSVMELISPSFCRKHNVIPISKIGRNLVVAFSDPSDIYVKDDLAIVTQMSIQVVVSDASSIEAAISRFYAPRKDMSGVVTDLESVEDEYITTRTESSVVVDSEEMSANDGPVIKFVNAILNESIQSKASDIHVEVYEKRCRVRYRIDGRLEEKIIPPMGTASAIASRLKIMSKLDIAEKRRPQDGRLKVKLSSGKEVDFRVSVIPVLFGEKIVMRLLDKSNLSADINSLGFTEREMGILTDVIHRPQGMVLITGPTGSGKTTTIYSILNELNTNAKNISTAEDPVEFNLDGINQVQTNSEIGFDFSVALRSFLRQDPDIIMVGEIRDKETAEIAFKAASTGHMVVSTLHTNNSLATITRLVDIGIPTYMVSEVVSLVIAQRLVRIICTNCKLKSPVPDETLLDLGVKQEDLASYKNTAKGKGCSKCSQTGYKGRMPIFEILPMTNNLTEGIIKEETASSLKQIALKDGMVTLRGSALTRLRDGLTTVEEVINTSVRDDL